MLLLSFKPQEVNTNIALRRQAPTEVKFTYVKKSVPYVVCCLVMSRQNLEASVSHPDCLILGFAFFPFPPFFLKNHAAFELSHLLLEKKRQKNEKDDDELKQSHKSEKE